MGSDKANSRVRAVRRSAGVAAAAGIAMIVLGATARGVAALVLVPLILLLARLLRRDDEMNSWLKGRWAIAAIVLIIAAVLAFIRFA